MILVLWKSRSEITGCKGKISGAIDSTTTKKAAKEMKMVQNSESEFTTPILMLCAMIHSILNGKNLSWKILQSSNGSRGI